MTFETLIRIAYATKANILLSANDGNFTFGAIAVIAKDDYVYLQYQPTLDNQKQREFWGTYISEFVHRIDADGVVSTIMSWVKSDTGQHGAEEVIVSVCESKDVFHVVVDIVIRDAHGAIINFDALAVAGTGQSFCRTGDDVGHHLKLIAPPERMFNRDGRVVLAKKLEDTIATMIDSQIQSAKIPLSEYLALD